MLRPVLALATFTDVNLGIAAGLDVAFHLCLQTLLLKINSLILGRGHKTRKKLTSLHPFYIGLLLL